MSTEYEDDLHINKFRLDEEWLNQSRLYAKYANLCSKLRKKHLKIWEKKKTRKAQLIKKFRKENPKAKNDEVESYWRCDKKYRRLSLEVIDAEYEYNILNNAVFAFSQRKTALEQEVKLYLSEYYSEPKPGDEKSHKYINDTKKSSTKDRIKNSLKSKRRKRK